ncbi:TIR domain-containing protein [Rhodococcus qingshengii]|uniref:TIR domain-containing protein n=1 Tax=Rhodococcus qingshengii TaxID=334542 RepID=UPI0036013379
MTNPSPRRPGHVFISYVREDSSLADELKALLEAEGFSVWMDRTSIAAGSRWESEIKKAITGNSLAFVACYSKNGKAKKVNGQNQELDLATAELRKRRPDTMWLFNVRFDNSEIPEYNIGNGQVLGDIQRLDFFGTTKTSSGRELVSQIKTLLDEEPMADSASSDARVALAGSTAFSVAAQVSPTARYSTEAPITESDNLINPAGPRPGLEDPVITEGRVHHSTMPQSAYDLIGREGYLANTLRASTSRRSRLRFGAGLDEQQVARSLLHRVEIPAKAQDFPTGEIRVLTGPLGSGKSEVAEEWFRECITRAQEDEHEPVPIFISAREFDETIDTRVARELDPQVLLCGVDIVIDGLDERTDLAVTKVQEASEFVARWPKSRALLTTRNNDLRDKSVQVTMNDMTDVQAAELMRTVSGRPMGSLGHQLQESVRRPLFAVLTAAHATANQGVTGTSELIDRIVEQVVEAEGLELIPQLMQLAIETVSTGRAVDPSRFASFEIASKIRRSPLVTVTGKACAFSLATFEQWFGAQAVLEGKIEVKPLLSSMRSFDRWKYVFAILLAAGEPTKVDPVMAEIARWNPGAAAWIIKETESGGLTRHLSELQDSDWESAGDRIRYAQAAWLDGLGPLGSAFFAHFTNAASSLEDVAVSVRVEHGNIRVSWIAPRVLGAHTLPTVLKPRQEHVGRSMTMKGHAAPTGVNWVWGLTHSHLRSDISRCFKSLVLATGDVPGVVQRELQARYALGTGGETSDTVASLYPDQDIRPSEVSPWGNFTAARMYERIVAIVTSALKCYGELVDRMVPNFTATLGTHGLLPVEFYGDINFVPDEIQEPHSFGPPEATLRWTLRARATSPFDEATTLLDTVNLTLNDEARSVELLDERDVDYMHFQAYLARSPEFIHFAPQFSTTNQGISVVDAMPATDFAMDLLWGDLENLNWVEGHRPRM